MFAIHTSDWNRQFFESWKEIIKLNNEFKESREVDLLDKAMNLMEELCGAYNLKNIEFQNFIEFGEGLFAGRLSIR